MKNYLQKEKMLRMHFFREGVILLRCLSWRDAVTQAMDGYKNLHNHYKR